MNFKYILVFLLIFLYLTQVRSAFSTSPIFYFFSVLGLGILLLDIINNKVNKDIFTIIVINLLLVLIQIISFAFNGQGDFYFIREVVLYNFISILFCLFFYKFNVKNKIQYDYIKIIAFAVLLQLLLSFYAFLNPSFFDLLFTVFPQNLGFGELDDFAKIRMVTLGTPFFGSAILSSVVVLILAQKINNNKETNFKIFLSFIVICALSILSARTAIIGVILSLFVMFSNKKNSYKYFFISIFIIIAIYILSKSVSLSNRFADLIDFGFKFIYNYKDSQASESVDGVAEMLSVVPDNVKTWLIGDGYYKASNGVQYYKNIDVGFLRSIFSFGIVGLSVFIFLNIFVIYKISKEYMSAKTKFLIFICFMLLMIKGLANIFPYLMLVYTLSLINKNRSNNNDINRNTIL